MTEQQPAVSPAKSSRIVHAALLGGVVLFALVSHFILVPGITTENAVGLSPLVIRVLLGLSLAASVLSLLLRRRIRQRSTDESADLFWTSASAPATLTWALVESGGLLAVFVYSRTGQLSALSVAFVALVIFAMLNPAYLERR